eukprot:GHVT01005215.1.p1 GENE.GHVT01005215.1~~GHVT01005215.1.p1  ORF type:complete len:122 (-),score=20.34 GHVT01005215.1:63-428(-)
MEVEKGVGQKANGEQEAEEENEQEPGDEGKERGEKKGKDRKEKTEFDLKKKATSKKQPRIHTKSSGLGGCCACSISRATIFSNDNGDDSLTGSTTRAILSFPFLIISFTVVETCFFFLSPC